MTGLVQLQDKAYLYCKKKKKLEHFHTPNVSMADAMQLYFRILLFFYPEFRKKHTIIIYIYIYTLKELLYMKKQCFF